MNKVNQNSFQDKDNKVVDSLKVREGLLQQEQNSPGAIQETQASLQAPALRMLATPVMPMLKCKKQQAVADEEEEEQEEPEVVVQVRVAMPCSPDDPIMTQLNIRNMTERNGQLRDRMVLAEEAAVSVEDLLKELGQTAVAAEAGVAEAGVEAVEEVLAGVAEIMLPKKTTARFPSTRRSSTKSSTSGICPRPPKCY